MESEKTTIRLQTGQKDHLQIVPSCGDDVPIGMLSLQETHHALDLWQDAGIHFWLRHPLENSRHLIGEINKQGEAVSIHPEYRELPDSKQPFADDPSYQGGIRFDSVKSAVQYLTRYFAVELCPPLSWKDLGLEMPDSPSATSPHLEKPTETPAQTQPEEEKAEFLTQSQPAEEKTKTEDSTPLPRAKEPEEPAENQRVLSLTGEHTATGRRKTAVAQVRIASGDGKITVNGRAFENYFPLKAHQKTAIHPLHLVNVSEHLDVCINVRGGGLTGQAEATRHGISRALLKIDAGLRTRLKSEGLLTRDPRMKERKKYGQPGARRRFQYSKR